MSQTIENLRAYGRRVLSNAMVELELDVVSLEVDLLLSAALDLSRETIMAHPERTLDEPAHDRFNSYLERRRHREPIAYILGRKEFYSLDFIVNSSVLIPRPDTELLVESALKEIRARNNAVNVVDIGSGSGAVLIAVLDSIFRLSNEASNKNLLEQSNFIACDISEDALSVLEQNALRMNYTRFIKALRGDLLKPLLACLSVGPEDYQDKEWIILSNPPYVKDGERLALDISEFEPSLALYAGPDGLDIISRLISEVREFFDQYGPGALLIEFGLGQGARIQELSTAAGFNDCRLERDLSGKERVAVIS